MSAARRDLVVCAVTLVGVVVCARYYVLAVLDRDRPLSRAAALASAIFGVTFLAFLLWVLM